MEETLELPLISNFLGISIFMDFDDHNSPLFQAEYNEDFAQIAIDPISVIYSKLPARALGLVFEWATEHQDELLMNWNSLRADGGFKKIAPLV